jgi:hypothetical protein
MEIGDNMSLFQIQENKDEHMERAKAMLAYANLVSTEILRLYEMGKEQMWSIPNYTIEDAQKLIDCLDTLVPAKFEDQKLVSPPGALQVFKYHGALGHFLATIGMIDPASVASPVEYRLDGLKIVLTGNRYPTEPLPPEDSSESISPLQPEQQEPIT